ncbi:MAG: response regulator [Niastella sp.]|nr:response regulator [Niastella sp.]
MVATKSISNKELEVLIIDSASIVASRMFDIIGELQFVKGITWANNYMEALQSLDNTFIDVVLMDIQLPDMNGLDVLKAIKKKHPKMKVIVLTNKFEENYKILCEKLGSDHFFDKSAEFDKVSEILKSYAA